MPTVPWRGGAKVSPHPRSLPTGDRNEACGRTEGTSSAHPLPCLFPEKHSDLYIMLSTEMCLPQRLPSFQSKMLAEDWAVSVQDPQLRGKRVLYHCRRGSCHRPMGRAYNTLLPLLPPFIHVIVGRWGGCQCLPAPVW